MHIPCLKAHDVSPVEVKGDPAGGKGKGKGGGGGGVNESDLLGVEGDEGGVKYLASSDEDIGDAHTQEAGCKADCEKFEAIAAHCSSPLSDCVGCMALGHPLKSIVRTGIEEPHEGILRAVCGPAASQQSSHQFQHAPLKSFRARLSTRKAHFQRQFQRQFQKTDLAGHAPPHEFEECRRV